MTDGAGEVLAVGEGVKEFSGWRQGYCLSSSPTGSRVRRRTCLCRRPSSVYRAMASMANARELVVGPTNAFTHAPRGFPMRSRATLVCAGLTAWRALVVEGHLKAGDTVLLQGNRRGVVVRICNWPKRWAPPVVATSSSVEKLERLKAFGADHLINYRSEPQLGRSGASPNRRTWGRPTSLRSVAPLSLPQSAAASRVGGHVAMIGQLSGQDGSLPTMLMMGKQLRISWMMVGSRAMQLDMVRFIEANQTRPVLPAALPCPS